MALILAVVLVLISAPAAADRVVVAIGDSLTAGFGLTPADALPAVLERRLRAGGLEVRVVNSNI